MNQDLYPNKLETKYFNKYELKNPAKLELQYLAIRSRISIGCMYFGNDTGKTAVFHNGDVIEFLDLI